VATLNSRTAIHAQKFAAGAARRDIDKRGAGVFNAIEQEDIVLGRRPLTANMLPTEEFEVPMPPEAGGVIDRCRIQV